VASQPPRPCTNLTAARVDPAFPHTWPANRHLVCLPPLLLSALRRSSNNPFPSSSALLQRPRHAQRLLILVIALQMPVYPLQPNGGGSYPAPLPELREGLSCPGGIKALSSSANGGGDMRHRHAVACDHLGLLGQWRHHFDHLGGSQESAGGPCRHGPRHFRSCGLTHAATTASSALWPPGWYRAPPRSRRCSALAAGCAPSHNIPSPKRDPVWASVAIPEARRRNHP
jgi:hypothetical protein